MTARLIQPIHANRTAYAGRSQARSYAPRSESPTAERIAAELAAFPEMLRLRSRRIIADVMQSRRVGRTTAWQAVAFARELVA